MKKKVIIISIILVILVGLGIISYIVIDNVNKEKKLISDNIKIINDNYHNLSESVKSYNKIREEFNTDMGDFYLDKFKDNKGKYEELLTKYNEIIIKIDGYADKISSKCDMLYKDTNVMKICNNYGVIYEKLVNIYVTDLSSYNDKIKEYNKYKNDNQELFKMVHSDYVDYNSDNVFEGRSNNGES